MRNHASKIILLRSIEDLLLLQNRAGKKYIVQYNIIYCEVKKILSIYLL